MTLADAEGATAAAATATATAVRRVTSASNTKRRTIGAARRAGVSPGPSLVLDCGPSSGAVEQQAPQPQTDQQHDAPSEEHDEHVAAGERKRSTRAGLCRAALDRRGGRRVRRRRGAAAAAARAED